MRIFERGQYEVLKAGFHGTAGLLCLTMCAYNAGAWVYRMATDRIPAPERLLKHRHLARNAVLYAAATAWEASLTVGHLHPPVKRERPDYSDGRNY